LIGQILAYVPKEKVIPSTNCGMAPMRRDIAEQKLVALGKGVALARKKLAS
jgi:5-methyltetrahydropteroyltriglutamate--homocysteine methyltransferase